MSVLDKSYQSKAYRFRVESRLSMALNSNDMSLLRHILVKGRSGNFCFMSRVFCRLLLKACI